MIISYLGHSSFKIKTNTATLITDPFDNSTGLHFVKQESDIVTISHQHQDHNNKAGIKNDNCFFIENPGEYEIKDVMIRSYKTFHDSENGALRGENYIFLIQTEGQTICHLGDLGHELSDKIYKEIEATDILMIPVGGTYTIDASLAAKIVHKVEPSIVLPMHYKTAGLASRFDQLTSIDEFANKLNASITREEKLNVKDSSLPEETMVYQLEIKG